MMLRQEFLAELERKLCGMPREDVQERLTFYSEMIDDRMEDGLTEAQAVSELGTVDTIIAQVMTDASAKAVQKAAASGRSLSPWEIVLLALGAPIWLSLLAALLAAALAVYAAAWSLIAALWASEIALGASTAAGALSALFFAFRGAWLPAAAVFGAAMACAGLTILGAMVCVSSSRGVLRLTGRCIGRIKFRFSKKEAAK